MYLISGATMHIHLKRQYGYHVVQTFIPSVVFVTLSWLGLFLPADAIPGIVYKFCINQIFQRRLKRRRRLQI